MRTSALRRWLREQRAAENATGHAWALLLAGHEIAAQENARQWMAADTRWFYTDERDQTFVWDPPGPMRPLK